MPEEKLRRRSQFRWSLSVMLAVFTLITGALIAARLGCEHSLNTPELVIQTKGNGTVHGSRDAGLTVRISEAFFDDRMARAVTDLELPTSDEDVKRGSVVGLHLDRCRLGSQAAATIASLKHLRRLAVDGEISDDGWRNLMSARVLADVEIVVDELTLEAAKTLASLPQLKQLHLSVNRADDEAWRRLATSGSLTSLVCIYTTFSPGAFTAFATAPKLESLTLAASTYDPSSLSQLKGSAIRRLHLTNQHPTAMEFAAVSELTQLQHLLIHSSNLDARHLEELKELPHLTSLSFAPRDSGPVGIEFIARFPRLERLYLNLKRPPDAFAALSRCPSLTMLEILGDSRWGDGWRDDPAVFPQLLELQLRIDGGSDGRWLSLAAPIRRKCPNLQRLHIHGAEIDLSAPIDGPPIVIDD